ncbi:MAG: NAD(P)/FAD-dependent oxidoreductase [Phycisphaerales bacterium]|nr:NAD(P)/FAD-dependent oxidoreductase [Phycisphaerales bacterium]
MSDSADGRRHVVIVGGGFGGLACAKALARADWRITIVDRENHHLFQPLLYQVATAVLSPADIAAPIRTIVRRQRNTEVVLGQVVAVDVDARRLRLADRTIDYDTLVLATGATHSYFGHDEWQPHAPGLKTIDDALELRRRLLLAFEAAEYEPDPDTRRACLTFVVVGGGPTGVELAGALIEIAARSIPRDFRRIDTTTTKVILVEAGERLLGGMPATLGDRAKTDLEHMGVDVRLRHRVTHIDETGAVVGDERIPAANVFWAAGVTGSALARTLGVPLDPAGRVIVDPDLTVPGHPELFVIGDLAHVEDPATGTTVPGIAPAAMQMGRHVAATLRRRPDADRPPFRYRDTGTMATIGRNRAVAAIGGRRFTGLVAWLLWSLVHVYFLIGFRRRMFVMLSWAWNYVVFAKGARLITGRPPTSSDARPPT